MFICDADTQPRHQKMSKRKYMMKASACNWDRIKYGADSMKYKMAGVLFYPRLASLEEGGVEMST